MAKGRQARILGKKMVINLNTKGGVRKSPGTNSLAKCIAPKLAGKKFSTRAAQRAAFSQAVKECKSGVTSSSRRPPPTSWSPEETGGIGAFTPKTTKSRKRRS